MIVSIHQPAYLPWLGYFDKIRRADRFIYLDTVQFQKNSFQNRNRVRSKSGPIWLTVPVITKGRLFSVPLGGVTIDNTQTWQSKHLVSMEMNYRRAERFSGIFPLLETYYRCRWDTLSELCWEMLMEFNRLLGIDTPIVRASEMDKAEGSKSDLVLNLCRATGATTYLSGSLGRDYLKLEDFDKAGIEVVFQDYVHPTYRQVYPGLEPFMGIVDLLFNAADPGRILGV